MEKIRKRACAYAFVHNILYIYSLCAHTCFLRLPSEEAVPWRGEGATSAPKAPSPGGTSASQAWLNRVTQEEEERKRRGMEEEEEGRKRTAGGGGGGGGGEEKEDEGRAQKDAQDKVNKLFSQQPDPWVSTGVCCSSAEGRSDWSINRLV